MSYFSGTQAVNIEDTVLAALQSYLQTKLAAAPYVTTFARWAGPGVCIDPNSDFAPNARSSKDAFSRKPWLYLEVLSRETSNWGKTVNSVFYTGTRHTLQISAEVLTSDSCLPAERPLKDALNTIVCDGYHALWDAGLEETDIRASNSQDANYNRINPHIVGAIAYTLNI